MDEAKWYVIATMSGYENKVVLPELKKGKIVICDRYFYSCLANLRARGYINDEWIYEISENLRSPRI